MHPSLDKAYDRAARKIWRALIFATLLPAPLIFLQAWLRKTDQTISYLLLGLGLFWCAVAIPCFLIAVRRGFGARTLSIANAANLFAVPYLVGLRFPTDIIRDCGGDAAWQSGALAAIGALLVLLWLWLQSVSKDYQAQLPREEPSVVEEKPPASGPQVI